ncbi:MAG: elongator complex protein 3 [Desulfovibrionaceae bacterium]
MSSATITFSLPWPDRPHGGLPILPVFLPFSGCPVRCIFCAQHIQTGQRESMPLSAILDQAAQRLSLRRTRQAGPAELAFFGGTFTAMPEEMQAACLALARRALHEGDIRALRCSTRPDCVTPEALARLRTSGCTTVELGVQSFDNAALSAARRGYDGARALAACAQVRTAGLRCGVQLMPGMPGVTPEIFLRDVRRALDAGASCLRFYPCLVLRGTELARMYAAGSFTPWPMDVTVDALAEGWLLARAAHVPVIRLGLAPEAGLDAAIMAGPAHPALGAEVQARALLRTVRRALAEAGASRITLLHAPRPVQGCFWGNKRHLAREWAALGVTPATLRWTDEAIISGECAPEA